MTDLLDAAVDRLVNDDYNHIPETTLRERLAAIRGTRMETRLEERADDFIREVRDTLSGWDPTDPEYGPGSTDTTHICVDGRWIDDADVPTETNEHGDRWCSRCGERILVESKVEA